MWAIVVLGFVLGFCRVPGVDSHGRMVEPPARNTMWRMDFYTPENYDDTELFCGGLKVTHEDNGGKCGLCGDRYDLPVPRPHESGGNYTSGVIGRTYQPGRILDVIVEIVANHKGYFEFSLCERNDPNVRETEECFDKRLLELADGTGTKFHIPRDDNGFYIVPIKIPQDVSCSHCILRWHWRSANNWGDCENNTKAVGCGPQEIYRNCADISVLSGAGVRGSAGFNPRPRVPKAMKKYNKQYHKNSHSPFPLRRRL
ncbi:hypothetical protein AVEN_50955-1 [Araneus ventricosus]|uniref:Chitin-binding type-4 domain-containing protein n=1 Tax=Araneus ventricosus TaxID=182803 RepID=A0A4Y2R180_ARAVE|nr:hypothetical protein AVEN_50955-1 [Araneus ventricosus]